MSNNKIIIIIDMEGCIGVLQNTSERDGVQLMIKELKSLLDIFTLNDKLDISVLDFHNTGCNFNLLHSDYPNVKFIEQIWNYDLNEEYDVAMLIGFHGKASTNCIKNHSFRPEIKKIILGENEVGETRLIENLLAKNGVSVVFASGSEHIKSELINTECIFFKTGGEAINFEKLYSVHNQYSINAIDNKKNTTYDASSIKVHFYNDVILELLPLKIFNIESDYILYKNTIEFIQDLPTLAVFLNSSNKYFRLILNNFIKLQRDYRKSVNHYARKINDNKLQSILNNDIEFIKYSDILYTFGLLKQKLGEYK